VQEPQGQQPIGQNQQPVELVEGLADWPEELPALGQQLEQVQQIAPVLNLNLQPMDLNAAPVMEDPEEMIIHPPQFNGL